MIQYQNGNANITLKEDGTRIIDYVNDLQLEYPLNIDIRVSNQCDFGMKEDGTYVLCSFCHESAKVNGSECDYNELKLKLSNLPQGIELAIGCNNLTNNLMLFLEWSTKQGYVNNLTINQGHTKRDCFHLLTCIDNNWIKGLGISYRSDIKFNVPLELINYNNTVFHVIIGIDSIEDVLLLKEKGVRKILCLGEKDFGANIGNVNVKSLKHIQWRWWIQDTFSQFDVVSFDNLAIEQLNLKRFFSDNEWKTFYQGEYSFYINAVDKTFSPSSRNPSKVNWDKFTVKDYFNSLI